MNFNLPYRSPNIKYDFKVTKDQFGRDVENDYHDDLEIVAIREFEKYMLKMVKEDPSRSYTMIELGSNQAYYSLMFHSILKKYGATPRNILIEALEENLNRGLNHFEINGFEYESRLYSVGNLQKVYEALETISTEHAKTCLSFNPNWRTLSELFEEFELDYLDVLQCDIDCSEGVLFETSQELFRNKKVKYIFLSTHEHFHEISLEFLKEFKYEILLNHDKTFPPVGYDTFIIARA
jgi:hypothetical protein